MSVGVGSPSGERQCVYGARLKGKKARVEIGLWEAPVWEPGRVWEMPVWERRARVRSGVAVHFLSSKRRGGAGGAEGLRES